MTVTDQLGREISFSFPPKRIVSVVPSQTELLFDLGLNEAIAGVTWFCIHPELAKTKTKVGGTKNLKLEKIAALNPDLIIANKEENEQSQIEWLIERFPVWISDIKNMDQSLEMIRAVGEMTDTSLKAAHIINEIHNSFAYLKPANQIRTLYLIWKEPWMSIGADTFISSIMERCGLVNVAGPLSRYPEFTSEEIEVLSPDLVLLSSEPFPFKEKHIEELQTLLPNAKIRLADGEMFSWYGSRLIEAGEYLKGFVGSL
jgi:ABC-type Fe3+-hydroxamate transport system substrate-binding protein